MGTGVRWFALPVARLLATRAATPMIVASTIAIASLGAAAMHPATAHHASNPVVGTVTLNLDSSHTFCYADPVAGDSGHTICHILASQVSTIPNQGCSSDPDGDGTFVCSYATDPRNSN